MEGSQRTTCCFCFDLKHGSLAVGIFTLVTRLILLIVFSILLGVAHQNNDIDTGPYDIIYGIVIGECALSVFFAIFLVIGVQKTIRGLFIPWIVLNIIDIGGNVYSFIGSLFIINGVLSIAQTFGYLIGAVFLVYQSWCVISYYRSLSAPIIPYQNFNRESNEADIPRAPINLKENI